MLLISGEIELRKLGAGESRVVRSGLPDFGWGGFGKVKREKLGSAMSMIVELSKDVEAALAVQAKAAQLPTEVFLAKMVELAVENRRRIAVEQLRQHLGVMAESIPAETTPDEMERAFEDAFAAIRPMRR